MGDWISEGDIHTSPGGSQWACLQDVSKCWFQNRNAENIALSIQYMQTLQMNTDARHMVLST